MDPRPLEQGLEEAAGNSLVAGRSGGPGKKIFCPLDQKELLTISVQELQGIIFLVAWNWALNYKC